MGADVKYIHVGILFVLVCREREKRYHNKNIHSASKSMLRKQIRARVNSSYFPSRANFESGNVIK